MKSGDDCRQEHLAVQLISHFYGGLLLLILSYCIQAISSSLLFLLFFRFYVGCYPFVGSRPLLWLSICCWFSLCFSSGLFDCLILLHWLSANAFFSSDYSYPPTSQKEYYVEQLHPHFSFSFFLSFFYFLFFIFIFIFYGKQKLLLHEW